MAENGPYPKSVELIPRSGALSACPLPFQAIVQGCQAAITVAFAPESRAYFAPKPFSMTMMVRNTISRSSQYEKFLM